MCDNIIIIIITTPRPAFGRLCLGRMSGGKTFITLIIIIIILIIMVIMTTLREEGEERNVLPY